MSDNLAHKLNDGGSKPAKFSGFAELGKPVEKIGSLLQRNKGSKKTKFDKAAQMVKIAGMTMNKVKRKMNAGESGPVRSMNQELELGRLRHQARQQEERTPAPDDNYQETDEGEDIGQSQDQPEENGSNNTEDSQSINNPSKDKNSDESKDKDKDSEENKDKPTTTDKDEKTNNTDKPSSTNDPDKKDSPDKKEDKPEGLGPKPEKENLKIPAGKSDKGDTDNKPTPPADNDGKGASAGAQLKQATNIASKALAGDATGSAEETAKLGGKVGSQWVLTTLWGAVWFDWTLLTLLGLNVFLAVSLLLPNYICQFGDDYLFGKWIPNKEIAKKEIAKWVEIIMLMIINTFVLSIIIIAIVLIYKLVSCSWWDVISGSAVGAFPGGDSALASALKSCFQ